MLCAELKEEGAISTHVLNMIDQIRYLERHGIVFDERLGLNVILSFLPGSYAGFVLNFHIHSMQATYEKLYNILHTAEQDLRNATPHYISTEELALQRLLGSQRKSR